MRSTKGKGERSKRMRLIDADALVWKIKTEKGGIPAMLVAVNSIPTVDAVQVVRCKDCAKRGTINCNLDYCGYRQSDDWYCADGERRSE